MSKLLFISNISNKIGAFSIASVTAARETNMEFHMASYWDLTRENMDKLQEDFNVKLHHIDSARLPYSFRNYKAFKQLVKIIRDEKIDYIHCNTPIGGILGRLAGKKCKVKKVIYQAHGFHFYKGAPKKNWLLYYPVEKWLAHYTDGLITINKEDYELAKAKLKLRNNGNVYYVPGVGINTGQYKTEKISQGTKRSELNIPLDAFVIISVGELNENKNHETIIRAIHACGYENIHYMIAGKGVREGQLKELAKELNVSDRIHFLGFCNNIPELLHTADLFCFPSYREGLSISLMEAMASGVPVIASDIRGNRDLIDDGKGGYLVKPEDVEGFAKKITELCTDSEKCKKFAEYSCNKVKNFDIKVSVEELKKIYNSII